MIGRLDTAHQVWKSVKETLLGITKENEINISETLHCLKKGDLPLEEYIKRFKALCDKLAAMKKPLDDLSKCSLQLEDWGNKYKEFRTAMLSKTPYPTFNQFVLSLKAHEQMNLLEEEGKALVPNINQSFLQSKRKKQWKMAPSIVIKHDQQPKATLKYKDSTMEKPIAL